MELLYKNIKATLKGGNNSIIQPQRINELLNNDKILLVNTLSDDLVISNKHDNIKNSYGKKFIESGPSTGLDSLDDYEAIIFYCANYTCSASKDYQEKFREKYPEQSAKILLLEYPGGIYEWALLSLVYGNYKIFNKHLNKELTIKELHKLVNSNQHRINNLKQYPFIDELKLTETLTPISKPSKTSTKLLEGKVCVVTGATSGLGLETLKLMLDNGAKHVTGTWYNDKRRAERVSAELNKTYGSSKVLILQADARTIEGNKMCFDNDERKSNSDIPDDCVAINCVNINAGIFGPASYNNKHLHQLDFDKYDEVMNLNLRGYALGVQAFIKQAIYHKIQNASIVCIKSIYGSGGSMFSNPAYQISKHGTMGLVRQTAIEYARTSKQLGIPFPIKINAVSPTFTTTALTKEMLSYDIVKNTIENSNPKGHLAHKRNVCNATVWLLSEESGDITGADLPVDCGVLAEVIPTKSEVIMLNEEKNVEFLSCCGATNDPQQVSNEPEPQLQEDDEDYESELEEDEDGDEPELEGDGDGDEPELEEEEDGDTGDGEEVKSIKEI